MDQIQAHRLSYLRWKYSCDTDTPVNPFPSLVFLSFRWFTPPVRVKSPFIKSDILLTHSLSLVSLHEGIFSPSWPLLYKLTCHYSAVSLSQTLRARSSLGWVSVSSTLFNLRFVRSNESLIYINTYLLISCCNFCVFELDFVQIQNADRSLIFVCTAFDGIVFGF